LDFTAPAVSSCTTITVTSTTTLRAGDVISIGTGSYSIDTILSDTVMTICNDGDGITPGTVVVAQDGAGNFQYPIAVLSNCCDDILGAGGGRLGEEALDTFTNVNDTVTTTPTTDTIVNTSTTPDLKELVIFTLSLGA